VGAGCLSSGAGGYGWMDWTGEVRWGLERGGRGESVMIMVQIGRGRPGRAGWEQDEDVLLARTLHYDTTLRFQGT
jgi:hypothetical protein